MTIKLPVPMLIEKRVDEIYKKYLKDENWAVIVHLVASKYKITINDKNARKFILDYFIEITTTASLYFESVTEMVMNKLQADDIYKGVRIKYNSGTILSSKKLSGISDKL